MTIRNIYKKLLTKYMYLNDLKTRVTKEGDRYTVIYYLNDKNGMCIYEERQPLSMYQPRPIHVLTEVSMSDIIGELNNISPLKEEDLPILQMEIREDSLNRIKESLQGL